MSNGSLPHDLPVVFPSIGREVDASLFFFIEKFNLALEVSSCMEYLSLNRAWIDLCGAKTWAKTSVHCVQTCDTGHTWTALHLNFCHKLYLNH